jgi:hypothetical protein
MRVNFPIYSDKHGDIIQLLRTAKRTVKNGPGMIESGLSDPMYIFYVFVAAYSLNAREVSLGFIDSDWNFGSFGRGTSSVCCGGI